ncbi:hypothetical protein Agub_g1876, partial [Astrephomene gubernaculifera]
MQHQNTMGPLARTFDSFLPRNIASFQLPTRRLLAWSDNTPFENWTYVVACLFLTLFAGIMSGLTLGLLSLDTVELEVLLRSGTAKEQKYARKIMPIVSNSHFLLVTLLLCNAVAMEALPLFLDNLADPVTAVVVSVTAVLFFGEIVPQSVCSRYGLRIGATLAPFVRLLMWLCSPIAWPTGKLLDLLLGADHHTLFRRRQLKELVSIHAEDAGLGGALTRDEIKVITGALDLTSKVAYRAMTPLDKVFMLSSSDRLDEATLRAVLRSGHSRIPVHAAGERSQVVGLLLVKELLQYRLGSSEVVPVDMLRMRSIPRLPATTPMYDMLRLFQTGRSHIAVLTQPPRGELRRLLKMDATAARSGRGPSRGSGMNRGKSAVTAVDDGAQSAFPDGAVSDLGPFGNSAGAIGGNAAAAAAGAMTPPTSVEATPEARGSALHDDLRSMAGDTEAGYGDPEGYTSYSLYGRLTDGSTYAPSMMDRQDSYSGVIGGGGESTTGGEYMMTTPLPLSRQGSEATEASAVSRQGSAPEPLRRLDDDLVASADLESTSAVRTTPDGTPAAAADAGGRGGGAHSAIHRSASVPTTTAGPHSHRRTRMGLEADAAAAAAASASSGVGGGLGSICSPGDSTHGTHGSALFAALEEAAGGSGEGQAGTSSGHAYAVPSATPAAAAASASARLHLQEHEEGCHDAGLEEDPEEPEEGRPIGIITIEDVIEELIRTEIVDETDRYVDNNRLIRVNPVLLAQSLPEHLARVLAVAGAG